MRVRITFEVSDDDRRGIAAHFGHAKAKASHSEVAAAIYALVSTWLEDMTQEAERLEGAGETE